MVQKTLKTALFATIITAALCAGAVSARQLGTETKGFDACRGTCSSAKPCPSGCICAFPLESTTGACSTHPTGAQPAGK
jgi:hypothetical protein